MLWAWPGSSILGGTPTYTAQIHLYRVSGSGNCEANLYDATNSLEWCTTGNVTSTTDTNIAECTSVTNVATGVALMQVRVSADAAAFCGMGAIVVTAE